MSDAAVVSSAPAVAAQAASPKKPKQSAAAAKKPKTKPAHPPTSEMVNAAVKNLKERGGSSLQAIKKYIAANYKVDAEKLAPFIRKYLKSAVTSGALVQTKGKGASGSFKLSTVEKTEKKVSKPSATKSKGRKSAVKPAKPATKKLTKKVVSSPSKAATKSPAKKVVKAKAPAKPKAVAKSPKKSKALKSTKGAPTKKPKTPKPKKAAAKPKAAVKKAAPKK